MWVGMVRDRRVRSSWTLYIQKARDADFSLSSKQGGVGVQRAEAGSGERGTYLDGTVQRAIVDAFELLLNGLQIDLGTADNDANQCGVIGTSAVHGLVQTIGEKCSRRLNALNCKKEGQRHDEGADGLVSYISPFLFDPYLWPSWLRAAHLPSRA